VARDRSLVSQDDIYSHGADHFVLCAASIDDIYGVTIAEVGDALDRAQADDATLHLYTHTPGLTVAMATLEGTLAAVSVRGMRFATYDDLNAGEVPGSLALSFDDHAVAAWSAMRPMLDHHGARVTFFISSFLTLTDDERAQIQQLADDGHDIEYHSTNHFDAVSYSMAAGMDAYLDDDIVPGLDAIGAAGYTTPIFAYPYGDWDARVGAAVRAAGFRAARGMGDGPVNTPANRFALKSVLATDDMPAFARALGDGAAPALPR